MKYHLKFEAIGDNISQMMRLYRWITDQALGKGAGDVVVGHISSGWVAEITGKDKKYKFRRHFLRGFKDYSKTNSAGSRGVFISFFLDEDKLYEACYRVTWGSARRYFCIIKNGCIIELSEKEAREWLKQKGLWE